MFIVVDIGCIECGEGSRIVGVFALEEDAKTAASEAEDWQRDHWEGQHYFEIFHHTSGIQVII